MNYWLVKTEPDTFSWDDLVRDKKTVWDGVRNFQARSNLKAMKKGDLTFFYHTGDEKAIVGIGKVEAGLAARYTIVDAMRRAMREHGTAPPGTRWSH